MDNKIKVLFVTQSKLQHYRIPIFRLVNSDPKIELTLAHCGNTIVQNDMPEILLKKRKYGFFCSFEDFELICNDFDIILCMSYYNNISILKSIVKKKHKIVLWGIGVPASYNRHYGDASTFRYRLENYFQNKTDALLYYSNAPVEIYRKRGIKLDEKKVFIANNTVEVKKQPIENDAKKSLLFIGTLYLEKGLQALLDAYREAYEEQRELFALNIVGGGAQFEKIQGWVKLNGLENKINMMGAIYDTNEKAEIFKKSIACISPMQAGLSVLESMGYGVPFVTCNDAITGGEIFNIKNNENGLLINKVSQIKAVILDIYQNKEKYLSMGEKAYDYYWNNRTPMVMASGIISAIYHANKNQ